jgi:hypothetical protein
MKNAVFLDVVPCRSWVASHLLTLVPRMWIFLPWRWWRFIPLKRWFTQDLYSATSQKMTFFIVTAVKTQILQSWSSLPSIIHFWKFHHQHQCSLQLVWGHGVLLICTVCSEMALPWKLVRTGHTYIYTFLLRMTNTMTFQNTDLSSWDTLYRLSLIYIANMLLGTIMYTETT